MEAAEEKLGVTEVPSISTTLEILTVENQRETSYVGSEVLSNQTRLWFEHALLNRMDISACDNSPGGDGRSQGSHQEPIFRSTDTCDRTHRHLELHKQRPVPKRSVTCPLGKTKHCKGLRRKRTPKTHRQDRICSDSTTKNMNILK